MIMPPATLPSDSVRTLLRNTFRYPETTDAAAVSDTTPLSIAEPQPIYTATIDALLSGKVLEEAKFSGWQYVLVTDEEPQGVVEVSEDDAESYDVLRPREYALILNEVVARAEEVKGRYELRILRIPSIYLVAVWLKPAGRNGSDWLLPVAPPSPDYVAQQRFTAEQLAEKLRPLAVKRRDTEDRKR